MGSDKTGGKGGKGRKKDKVAEWGRAKKGRQDEFVLSVLSMRPCFFEKAGTMGQKFASEE